VQPLAVKAKLGLTRRLGASPVVVDALGQKAAMVAAVCDARPEIIVQESATHKRLPALICDNSLTKEEAVGEPALIAEPVSHCGN
jgi:hypothetical protein